ncbi:MAG: glycoside hydrolase [Gemmataceae bacterium]|nr:glycoside hydrolase [Gemmataceae bacterium]
MHRSVLSILALTYVAGSADAQQQVIGVKERVRIASGVGGHIHPALCITRKGTLIAIFSQSDYKDLKIARSTDGGKTWTKPAPYPHTEKTSFYPGALTTLGDGRIVHAWNVWYPQEKKKSRYVAFSFSSDDGLTWSEPTSLPKNPDKESVVRHPIVELSPRQWLFALADKTVTYDPASEKLTPFGDGRVHGLVPIVRTQKGTLVGGAGLRSTDGGKTWAKVSPFPKIADQGWRHELLALSNGWIVASDIVGPGIGGETISFIVSRDDGASWDVKNPMVYYHPGRPIGGRACPKSVEVDGQTLGTVFYDTDAKQDGGSGVFFLRTPLTRLQGK